MNKVAATDIDKYIATFPEEVKEILEKIRQIIRTEAPEASESINYGIPTFKLGGNLVHFAAFRTHIGLYPAPSAIEAFKQELSPYKGAKGSVQFPLDKPIPFKLIREIVKFRVIENQENEKIQAEKKKLSRRK